jgi:heat shock protein HtpX
VFDFSKIQPGRYTGLFRDLFVTVLPGLAMAGAAGTAYAAVGANALVLAGAGLIGLSVGAMFKTALIYPGGFRAAKNIDLLSEIDVSHIHPIPVIIDGELTGQLNAGVPWANDFIVQDQTAFMAAIYRQPLAILEGLFGLFSARGYVGSKVRVYGWYRRFTSPYIEIDHFTVHGSFKKVKCHFRTFKYVMCVLGIGLGAFLVLMR